MSDKAKHALHGGAPPFRWASLWEPAKVNHLNGKSYTLPILNLRDQYSINFHLAWLGFFVAFLSWSVSIRFCLSWLSSLIYRVYLPGLPSHH